MDTPDVIPITDFRKHTARILAAQVAAETPVYVTQGGYVTAVVLSPERYRGLVRLAQRGMAAERGGATERGTAASRRDEPRAPNSRGEDRPWPEDVFGFLDPETAEILASGGFEFE